MLKMPIYRLSKRELADAVARHCVDMGAVQSVIIMTPPAAADAQAYALVTMNSEAAVKDVVRLYGDGEIDGMALIRLESDQKAASSSPSSAPSFWQRLMASSGSVASS